MKVILIMFVCAVFLISIIVLAAFIRSAQISHREEEMSETKRNEHHPEDLLWIGIAICYLLQNLSIV